MFSQKTTVGLYAVDIDCVIIYIYVVGLYVVDID